MPPMYGDITRTLWRERYGFTPTQTHVRKGPGGIWAVLITGENAAKEGGLLVLGNADGFPGFDNEKEARQTLSEWEKS